MTVRPRHTAHRGSVDAIGVIVTLFAGDELAARRRILAVWEPGTTVFAVGPDAWFVRWPLARRLRCDRAPGLPVTVCGPVLRTAPLADDELAALAAPPGSLVVVRGGACEIVCLDRVVDVAAWLDVDGFTRVDVGSLGDLPRPAAPYVDPTPRPVRAVFGDLVAPPAPAARDVAAALQTAAATRRHRARPDGLVAVMRAAVEGRRARVAAQPRDLSSGTAPPSSPGRARPALLVGAGVVAALAAVLAAPALAVYALHMLAWLPAIALAAVAVHRALRPSDVPARTSSRPRPAPSPPPSVAPPEPSRDAWARLLARIGLMRWIGRRQVHYLRRLVDMFERGDYTEALRHAIPLRDGRSDAPPTPALGALRPRQDLQIHPAVTPVTGSVGLHDDDFGLLRDLYRLAHDRLVRDGRIDEAAFVLAELLHADEEAVAFLERHGRARLAAELAEARGLSPGLVVRQWFLAGDRERAVLAARRKGAFADAVARLERDPERRADAAALRLTWADTLADAGDYEVAVEIAAPVPEAISLVRAWMDRAIDRGGPAGARMLARKLQRFPEAFAEHLGALERLTDPRERAHTDARLELLATFAGGAIHDVVRAVARPLIRALLVDADRGDRTIDGSRVGALAQALGDDPLRVDLPRWPIQVPREPLRARGEPLVLELGPGDVGAIAARDVAVLPDGGLLVALGELGVRLYDRGGRLVWRADQPASALVLSDHGDRAIAVVERGRDVVRLARLDLVRRRAASWCEARLEQWAATYDGQTWVVAETSALRSRRSRLVLVDVLVDTELRALDRRDLDGGPILAIHRDVTACVAVTGETPAEPERWRWDLPDWTLRRREALSGPTVRSVVVDPAPLHPLGPGRPIVTACRAEARGDLVVGHVTATPAGEAREGLLHLSREGQRDGRVRGLPGAPVRLASDGDWIAVSMHIETCLEVHVLTASDMVTRAVVRLAGARQVALRFGGDALAITDDRGRVLAIDLRDGALSRSLRIL